MIMTQAANQIVAADLHVVAIPEFGFLVLIESGAGESNHDQHNAEVDDVSTVAACVAMRELDHGGEHTLSGLVGDNATAAIELAGNGEGNESCEKDRHQRVEITDVMPGLEAEDASPACRGEHHD